MHAAAQLMHMIISKFMAGIVCLCWHAHSAHVGTAVLCSGQPTHTPPANLPERQSAPPRRLRGTSSRTAPPGSLALPAQGVSGGCRTWCRLVTAGEAFARSGGGCGWGAVREHGHGAAIPWPCWLALCQVLFGGSGLRPPVRSAQPGEAVLRV